MTLKMIIIIYQMMMIWWRLYPKLRKRKINLLHKVFWKEILVLMKSIRSYHFSTSRKHKEIMMLEMKHQCNHSFLQEEVQGMTKYNLEWRFNLDWMMIVKQNWLTKLDTMLLLTEHPEPVLLIGHDFLLVNLSQEKIVIRKKK